MKDNFVDFTDLTAYKLSFDLSNLVWDTVIEWDYFTKDTIGKQLVRSTDSISANIAEGFGRYTKKDKIHFYRYSFGSLKETKSWLDKSIKRDLINKKQYDEFNVFIEKLPKEINTLIKYTSKNLTI